MRRSFSRARAVAAAGAHDLQPEPAGEGVAQPLGQAQVVGQDVQPLGVLAQQVRQQHVFEQVQPRQHTAQAWPAGGLGDERDAAGAVLPQARPQQGPGRRLRPGRLHEGRRTVEVVGVGQREGLEAAGGRPVRAGRRAVWAPSRREYQLWVCSEASGGMGRVGASRAGQLGVASRRCVSPPL